MIGPSFALSAATGSALRASHHKTAVVGFSDVACCWFGFFLQSVSSGMTGESFLGFVVVVCAVLLEMN